MDVTETPLAAPLNVGFDYTRSTGPVLGRFVTALRERRIEGVRGSDGRVHVPPVEYDPVTAEQLTDFVDVADDGTVVTWSWCPDPLRRAAARPARSPGRSCKLDGADTAMLHAVDAGSPDAMSTGMRVRARWAEEPVGSIRDIACFEPVDAEGTRRPTPLRPAPCRRRQIVTTPVACACSTARRRRRRSTCCGLQRGPADRAALPASASKVYIPPRGACPVDGVPTDDEVELPDRGIVTTFCIVNVPVPTASSIKPPYVAAYVLLDGADIAFLHLILDCPADDVRMGMRVEAVWRPPEEWGTGAAEHLRTSAPTGEPDADYELVQTCEHL